METGVGEKYRRMRNLLSRCPTVGKNRRVAGLLRGTRVCPVLVPLLSHACPEMRLVGWMKEEYRWTFFSLVLVVRRFWCYN